MPYQNTCCECGHIFVHASKRAVVCHACAFPEEAAETEKLKIVCAAMVGSVMRLKEKAEGAEEMWGVVANDAFHIEGKLHEAEAACAGTARRVINAHQHHC